MMAMTTRSSMSVKAGSARFHTTMVQWLRVDVSENEDQERA